jgi:ATP-dependent helicase/nuclease subunit B
MILTKENITSIDLDFEIDRKVKEGNLDELLLIVPTNRKIRSLKKELIDRSPGQTSAGINLETIGTFSTRILFGGSESRNKILSEAAASVLLKQSFQETKLKYFSNYKDEIPGGTLDRVKAVISEYKKHGITPELLRNESENLTGSEKIKAEDIASIFEIYIQKCDKLEMKETGDIYRELNLLDKNIFNKNFKELFPKVELIIINGFDEFTSPEIEIINSISEIEGRRLFLSFDYFKYNPLLFSHLDKCHSKLIAKGFKEIEDRSPQTLNKFQSKIREKFFHNKKNEIENGYKNSIFHLTAKNREKEIEIIAKEIKELISKKNAAPDKICLAFNLIGKYSPIIRDIFNVYGIPFNLTDRYSLSNSSSVISIINFLEILENDFYYKNIFRALSGGFIQLAGINLSNLLKTSVDLKIISGYKNWKDTINDALIRLNNSDDVSDSRFHFDVYRKAANDLDIIYEKLQPFDKKMNAAEFNDKLTELIYSLDLPSKLINSGSESIEEDVKALTVFIDTYREMLDLFEMEYGKNEKFSLKFFLNNIRTAVSSSRFNIKERPGFGVQVTTMNEIRGLNFDYVFLAGMVDGDMPTRYTPEIFFSGSYAKNERVHQTEQRYQFYQSLCLWKKGLYLTSPERDQKTELVQSNFLKEFFDLFETEKKNEKNYSETIYSKDELLKYLGEIGVQKFAEFYPEKINELDLPSIQKAIEVDSIRRKNPFDENKFTGHLSEELSENAVNYLKDFKEKEYSISQLETYAKCPYKYFAERILRLEPPEEPTEEIEALEMGTLLHEILFNFYKNLKEKRIILQNASDKDFKYAEDLIFKIASEKIMQANFNSPLAFYEKEKILGISGNKKNSILFKFLEQERDNPDGFIPEYFEIGFGNISDKENKNIFAKSFVVSGVNVRGKIDRIDLNNETGSYKVVDYKLSGAKPNEEDLTTGLSLQLPLYMFAAKELIKAQLGEEFSPAGSEIYSLKFNKDNFGRIPIFPSSGRKKYSPEEKTIINEEIILICIDAIEKYTKFIAEGKFNLTTLKDRENKVCRYCHFKYICRIEEAGS